MQSIKLWQVLRYSLSSAEVAVASLSKVAVAVVVAVVTAVVAAVAVVAAAARALAEARVTVIKGRGPWPRPATHLKPVAQHLQAQ
jgi:hypothetical protein